MTNRFAQHITVEESTSIKWVKDADGMADSVDPKERSRLNVFYLVRP